MKASVDMVIGAGLVTALILTVLLPVVGVTGSYERLQDTGWLALWARLL